MSDRIPFADYIQIHRRLRYTHRAYIVNNWRLLLPPFVAFMALGFALQAVFLVGLGATFWIRLLIFIAAATVALLDGPGCIRRRREIISAEWKQSSDSCQ